MCNAFDVKPDNDFRFRGDENRKLGTMYNYISYSRYETHNGCIYNSNKFTFIHNSTKKALKIDYIKQDAASEDGK